MVLIICNFVEFCFRKGFVLKFRKIFIELPSDGNFNTFIEIDSISSIYARTKAMKVQFSCYWKELERNRNTRLNDYENIINR